MNSAAPLIIPPLKSECWKCYILILQLLNVTQQQITSKPLFWWLIIHRASTLAGRINIRAERNRWPRCLSRTSSARCKYFSRWGRNVWNCGASCMPGLTWKEIMSPGDSTSKPFPCSVCGVLNTGAAFLMWGEENAAQHPKKTAAPNMGGGGWEGGFAAQTAPHLGTPLDYAAKGTEARSV